MVGRNCRLLSDRLAMFVCDRLADPRPTIRYGVYSVVAIIVVSLSFFPFVFFAEIKKWSNDLY